MKLRLQKKKIKNLSQDKKALPEAMTPMIAGGTNTSSTGSGAPDTDYNNVV
ncbi:hypothetical protein [Pseudoalteromonas denitrificans]|uniref:Uncharacterized protein n=1 Tax=Pseudoalteromonas denitrificans DSM 6059 TaxID=1123010 RepID=A0A1I1KD25_9GAMM|nr:hypothetical protein [Pseudoalteromonas denitrificans]SFC58172.1 hypothetical protein SAMN02745724_02022 [Pseudoalteromonas denitrificans DSM 6059]